MERYIDEVMDCVIEKARILCKTLHQVKVEMRVENGDPRDVSVMESHDYGIIKRAFLRSVSNYCTQNVKFPILIVKKPKPTATSADK